MEGSIFGSILETLNAVGTFLIGITALITLPRMLRKTMFKPEKLYGQSANVRYKEMENTLTVKNMVSENPYSGGDSRIFPQLTIERFYYDKETMQPQWKNCAREIHFYKEDEITKEKTETVWRL